MSFRGSETRGRRVRPGPGPLTQQARVHLPAFCPHRCPSAGGSRRRHDPGTGRRRLQDRNFPSTCRAPDAQRTQGTLPDDPLSPRPRPTCRGLPAVQSRSPRKQREESAAGKRALGPPKVSPFWLVFVSSLCGDRRPQWLEGLARPGSRVSRGSTSCLVPGCSGGAITTHTTPAFTEHPAGAGPVLSS